MKINLLALLLCTQCRNIYYKLCKAIVSLIKSHVVVSLFIATFMALALLALQGVFQKLSSFREQIIAKYSIAAETDKVL